VLASAAHDQRGRQRRIPHDPGGNDGRGADRPARARRPAGRGRAQPRGRAAGPARGHAARRRRSPRAGHLRGWGLTPRCRLEASMSDTWTLGARTFTSRIIVGTGKYASLDETRAAIEASGAEMVTV